QASRVAFVRSVDGGATFSAPRLLSSSRAVTAGPQVAVRGDEAVEVAWTNGSNPLVPRGDVLVATSHDAGTTFSTPRRIGSLRGLGHDAYDLVALATAGGRSLACWSSSGRATCARASGDRWRAPRLVDRRLPGVHDLIAVAGDERGRFWLGMYAVRPHA